jgi:uncharacterized membrane protein YeaQ/YmgE (transglycosylase-associated protein family)
MSIIGWLLLGIIAGFIASRIVGARGPGLLLEIVIGVAGALVGGALFSAFGAQGITGFNLYSMSVAIVGSVFVLWIYHTVTGRRSI